MKVTRRVWTLVAAGGLLVFGLVLLGVWRLVGTILVVANEPEPNRVYWPLERVAKARLTAAGTWHEPKIDTDVHLFGISQKEAWLPLTVNGMDIRVVERTYLPALTNKADKLYSIRLSGFSLGGSQAPTFEPKHAVRVQNMVSGVRFWVTDKGPTLTNTSASNPHTERWQFVMAPKGVSPFRYVPVFDPVPDYQVEAFMYGKRMGTFAAWKAMEPRKVRFALVGKSRKRWSEAVLLTTGITVKG